MIWKNRPSKDFFNSLGEGTLVSHLGIDIYEVGDDHLSARMPVDHRTKQPMGLLHGGASVALAETLGSFAAVCCLDDPSHSSVVGVEINANHLKAVREGYVIGTATPIRLGRKIQVWSIEIRHEEILVCVCRLTVMVVASK
ncbi:MAG: hotdog fold thioesterase [Saprospiraceae bacterium]|nr:hotdog fold thioesterase [Saprospiraceae bacterium]